MTTNQQFARVGDLAIHYDLADYTDPWRTDERETFLLYPGYCRNIEFWCAWVPLLGRDYRVYCDGSGGSAIWWSTLNW